jgi:hypothetical protein
MVFNKAYLKKIELTLLYLYNFKRANNRNKRESSKKKDREKIKNLAVL